MPPTTVAKAVVPPRTRVSIVTFHRARVRTSLPGVEMNIPPKLVCHHLRFMACNASLCPFYPINPNSTCRFQRRDLLHGLRSRIIPYQVSFLSLCIPSHLACLIHIARLFNRSFFPSPGLGSRVRCRATNVCIHSVDTMVRYFDTAGAQRERIRALE